MQDIHLLTIAELGSKIMNRQVSVLSTTRAFLSRIEALDKRTCAFITIMRDEALNASYQLDQEIAEGNYRGPLHGIPIGLKDIYNTKGTLTTSGSKTLHWSTFVPTEDATLVSKLRAAGAVLIGKLNTHEFASGTTNCNPHYGQPRNPWNVEHITGGSSGGSGAAVSASMCAGALGTDTGGSVRIPSALCGITGLKPTYGRLSRHGITPLSWSMDHAGPMTKTAYDAALMMNILAGYDPLDPTSADLKTPDFSSGIEAGIEGLRIGIPQEHFFDFSKDEVSDKIQNALSVLENLGASLVNVSIPGIRYVSEYHPIISQAEASAFHEKTIETYAHDLTPNVRLRLERGRLTTASQYIRSQRARSAVRNQIIQALANVEALVTPTITITAPRIAQKSIRTNRGYEPVLTLLSSNTAPFNDAGVPACTIPCGLDSSGLMLGIQIIGRPFEESTVLRIANAYQQVTDWHRRQVAL